VTASRKRKRRCRVKCLRCGWTGTRALSAGWRGGKGKTCAPCPHCRSRRSIVLHEDDLPHG
jgi:hypothetical protein